MNELRFLFLSLAKNIQNSVELRSSFLMNVVGMCVNNIAFILVWWFFVDSVGVINGWTQIDIIGLQGFTALSYGLVFSFGAGIKKLPDMVSSGNFDRVMLSPKNLLLRVFTSSFNASAVGDILFGIICIGIFCTLINAYVVQLIAIFYLLVVSILVLTSFSIVTNALSFMFIDSNMISGNAFEIFFTPALFHGGSFDGLFRIVFTFIIPSLVVGSLPVEIVKSLSWSQLILVGTISLMWLWIAVKMFFYGIKKYESSNLMIFGG